jgi:hypothetical protein
MDPVDSCTIATVVHHLIGRIVSYTIGRNIVPLIARINTLRFRVVTCTIDTDVPPLMAPVNSNAVATLLAPLYSVM